MHPIQMELNRVTDLGLPGAFAYVEGAEGTSRFHTAGFADLATQQRMTPDSRYRVGSTTKTFTAVVTSFRLWAWRVAAIQPRTT